MQDITLSTYLHIHLVDDTLVVFYPPILFAMASPVCDILTLSMEHFEGYTPQS